MLLPKSMNRILTIGALSASFSALIVAGTIRFPLHAGWPSYLFWGACTFLIIMVPFGRSLKTLAARWKFQARIKSILPETGTDQHRLITAATHIKRNDPERAFRVLENMSTHPSSPAAAKARRWLTALTVMRWMTRQRPTRTIPAAHHECPQIHGLVFSFGDSRVPLRPQTLQREISEAASADLDVIAQDYINLIDVLVASLGDRNAPFAEEAEEILTFMTGRSYMLGARERFNAWWSILRPVLVRGGGAVLVGARLMQRDCYAEAHELLTRLSEDGMLSQEADTMRRASGFLALFSQSQWRLTSSDIPRYFTQGYYYLAVEMGVLHFPTAELPEVVGCCRRGKVIRDAKRRLVEDALQIWDTFGDELAPQMASLLKRLLEQKGRNCPLRLSYWRELWAERKDRFEKPIALLMDGAAAANAGDLGAAEQLFVQASKLQPQMSLPLVNLVHVRMHAGNVVQAKELAEEIQRRFPKDAHAMISLGRLYAMHMDDTAEAEKLFLKAYELADPPTEALICLGEIKLMEGHYIESQEYFKHAREIDPTQPNAKLGLARVYMETKRYDLAIENLQSVASMGPPDARDLAHYLLYRTFREMSDDRKAVEYLDLVPQHFFKEPEVLDDIAVHLEGGKMYAKAREFAERAMILRASGHKNNDDPDALSAF